jgi:hypothetical protein
MMPILTELATLSARAAARELNARKVEMPKGKPCSAMTVIRARDRLAVSWPTVRLAQAGRAGE